MKRALSFLRDAQFWVALAVYAGFALVSTPPSIMEGGNDKTLHFLGNLALYASACLRPRPLCRPLLSWGLLLAFSSGVELAQALVPERFPDWRDLLANAGGLTLGLAGALMLQKKGFPRKKPTG
jgi:VanZ family protein